MAEHLTEGPNTALGIKIGKRTFLISLFLLLGILILTGALTRLVPQGHYQYEDMDGRSVVVPGSYRLSEGVAPLAVWRWFTAPFEALLTSRAVTAAMIIVFIMLLVGAFLVLEQSGILSYLIRSVIGRFGGRKYRLLALMILVCMAMGSFLGMCEETVTLAPITVALALMLGWDSLVGIAMSVLAVNLGFSSGTLNLFTIGVAQNLAELPVFSGLFFRLVFFAAIYGLSLAFIIPYAKKIEAHPEKSLMYDRDREARRHYATALAGEETNGAAKRRGLILFISALGLVFCYIAAAFFAPGLSDYIMPVMALLFTAGALIAGRVAGLRGRIWRTFFKGAVTVAPTLPLILIATSIPFLMETGGILDTILNFFYNRIEGLGPYAGALGIFVLVLLLDFFISQASSKAFLLIPIIVPLAEMTGITRQTAVQAFSMGDGFTNMLYPTNVVLLITLGIANVPYTKYFRWVWKITLALFAASAVALLIAVKLGYGPF